MPLNKEEEIMDLQSRCNTVCGWLCLVSSTLLFLLCVGLTLVVHEFNLSVKYVVLVFIVSVGGLYVMAFASSALLVTKQRLTKSNARKPYEQNVENHNDFIEVRNDYEVPERTNNTVNTSTVRKTPPPSYDDLSTRASVNETAHSARNTPGSETLSEDERTQFRRLVRQYYQAGCNDSHFNQSKGLQKRAIQYGSEESMQNLRTSTMKPDAVEHFAYQESSGDESSQSNVSSHQRLLHVMKDGPYRNSSNTFSVHSSNSSCCKKTSPDGQKTKFSQRKDLRGSLGSCEMNTKEGKISGGNPAVVSDNTNEDHVPDISADAEKSVCSNLEESPVSIQNYSSSPRLYKKPVVIVTQHDFVSEGRLSGSDPNLLETESTRRMGNSTRNTSRANLLNNKNRCLTSQRVPGQSLPSENFASEMNLHRSGKDTFKAISATHASVPDLQNDFTRNEFSTTRDSDNAYHRKVFTNVSKVRPANEVMTYERPVFGNLASVRDGNGKRFYNSEKSIYFHKPLAPAATDDDVAKRRSYMDLIVEDPRQMSQHFELVTRPSLGYGQNGTSGNSRTFQNEKSSSVKELEEERCSKPKDILKAWNQGRRNPQVKSKVQGAHL